MTPCWGTGVRRRALHTRERANRTRVNFAKSTPGLQELAILQRPGADSAAKSGHDGGIELGAAAPFQLAQSVGGRERRLAAPVLSHGLEGVRHREDPAAERNRAAALAGGIASAIPPFVTGAKQVG